MSLHSAATYSLVSSIFVLYIHNNWSCLHIIDISHLKLYVRSPVLVGENKSLVQISCKVNCCNCMHILYLLKLELHSTVFVRNTGTHKKRVNDRYCGYIVSRTHLHDTSLFHDISVWTLCCQRMSDSCTGLCYSTWPIHFLARPCVARPV